MTDVEILYRQHLSEADRQVLRDASGPDVPVSRALGLPATEAAVFGAGGGGGAVDGVSAFLVFATAVHRTAEGLESATFVEERWTPRVRIPVFDVAPLRVLLSEPSRRYFLVELLASFTRVASGVIWTRTARGWRRRRFSELDPGRLAGLLDSVRSDERPGVYRRLGDLALFLLGVFPDTTDVLGEGAAADRLLRLSGVRADRAADLGARGLLELLGARWYAAAVTSTMEAGRPVTGTLATAGHMAEHFAEARRVLNVVADRYLFGWRERWFLTG